MSVKLYVANLLLILTCAVFLLWLGAAHGHQMDPDQVTLANSWVSSAGIAILVGGFNGMFIHNTMPSLSQEPSSGQITYSIQVLCNVSL